LVALFLFYLQNVDAAPLEAVFDNVDVPQPIDRNGLLCNNVFEFAPNVFAIYLTRDLSVDYTFDLDANLPWYIPVWRAILKGLAAISKWWQEDVPNWVKVTVGVILIIASIVVAYFTGGTSTLLTSSAEVISTLISQALTQLLIGIGMAVVSWAINGLITGDFSWQSLENAVADAVFFTGLFAFVSASFNSFKAAFRVEPLTEEEIRLLLSNEVDKYIKLLHEEGLDPRFVSGVYDVKSKRVFLGYNSEIKNPKFNKRLIDIGARPTCAETFAVNKALNAGAKLKNLHMYTYNAGKNRTATACKQCCKAFYPRVKKILTGLDRNFIP